MYPPRERWAGPGPSPPTEPDRAPSCGSDEWEPLAGADLLERLRITGRPRPRADPDLAVRLRDGLEQGLRPPSS